MKMDVSRFFAIYTINNNSSLFKGMYFEVFVEKKKIASPLVFLNCIILKSQFGKKFISSR